MRGVPAPGVRIIVIVHPGGEMSGPKHETPQGELGKAAVLNAPSGLTGEEIRVDGSSK